MTCFSDLPSEILELIGDQFDYYDDIKALILVSRFCHPQFRHLLWRPVNVYSSSNIHSASLFGYNNTVLKTKSSPANQRAFSPTFFDYTRLYEPEITPDWRLRGPWDCDTRSGWWVGDLEVGVASSRKLITQARIKIDITAKELLELVSRPTWSFLEDLSLHVMQGPDEIMVVVVRCQPR
ncbi:MAG: hypothetical protein J3R72DRAFT_488716 [Linnemannia gamsii]|nr:MAG: hypothetical protein J3R72DRAFT_488716 [Linnemannia gamsii]